MIRVMYKSRKNNKKVAQAMAKALGVEAESIDGAQIWHGSVRRLKRETEGKRHRSGSWGVFLQRKRIYIQKHGKAGSGRSGGSKAVRVIRQGWQKELTNG